MVAGRGAQGRGLGKVQAQGGGSREVVGIRTFWRCREGGWAMGCERRRGTPGRLQRVWLEELDGWGFCIPRWERLGREGWGVGENQEFGCRHDGCDGFVDEV